MGFIDTGLAPGSTHTYQVRISDPFGNTLVEPQEQHRDRSAPARRATYAQDVVADGPSHYWRLGEPSGTDRVRLGRLRRRDADAAASPAARPAPSTVTATARRPSTAAPASAVDAERDRRARTSSPPRRGSRPPPRPAARSSASATSRPATSSSYDRHIYMDNAGQVSFGVYNDGVLHAQQQRGPQRRPVAPRGRHARRHRHDAVRRRQAGRPQRRHDHRPGLHRLLADRRRQPRRLAEQPTATTSTAASTTSRSTRPR